jgi:hypothetical protein
VAVSVAVNSGESELEASVICQSGVVVALLGVMLAPVAATAQPAGGSGSESIVTVRHRDLNGILGVGETVVTERVRTNDGEEVTVQTYLPSVEAGRLQLARRVHRVTTVTDEGSETVEETAESSTALPGERMRVVRRSVTTVRKTGPESSVTERRVFERDIEGRLVPVLSEVEQTSGK